MDTKVRRGGFLKGILFWPAEPTEKEIDFASEFLWSTVEIYDYLIKEKIICGANLYHNAKDDNYKDELAIAQLVLDYLEVADIGSAENGQLLIAKSFVGKYPCP